MGDGTSNRELAQSMRKLLRKSSAFYQINSVEEYADSIQLLAEVRRDLPDEPEVIKNIQAAIMNSRFNPHRKDE